MIFAQIKKADDPVWLTEVISVSAFWP